MPARHGSGDVESMAFPVLLQDSLMPLAGENAIFKRPEVVFQLRCFVMVLLPKENSLSGHSYPPADMAVRMHTLV